ncbi:GDSL esterase/lipase At1g28600-like [Argentina anserina]|uniref:GDSL esterase/lipase At1g28600-like n=1 Tax=Argentina anserina TaxID=57926 RepID=UPI0021764F43|nr:GDSL esterase/lipase At1g28600-like [Potentilla anserina]
MKIYCNELLSRSLILVGEIGGNDYNHALLAGKSIEQIQTYVPLVIAEISSTINELIELGAMTLVVPGNFPIGCLPIYLTKFQTSDINQYNSSTGCLNWLNKFAEYHNDQLQIELRQIQGLHPNVHIIYADYYNAVLPFYHSPDEFGFIGGTVEACCGCGGPYNYNSSAECGSIEASACENPAEFINWDGIHFTEAAYMWIAKDLLTGKFSIPSIGSYPCVFQRSDDL